MADIFISYRRRDSGGSTGRLYDRLCQEFGKENIFLDVENIPIGQHFVDYIKQKVKECKVLLVMIGPQWTTIAEPSGTRRLHRPDDAIRLEIATALAENKVIIPVLVEHAVMPRAQDLPADIAELAYLNASELSARHWEIDVNTLVAVLRHVLPRQTRPIALPVETGQSVSATPVAQRKTRSWMPLVLVALAVLMLVVAGLLLNRGMLPTLLAGAPQAAPTTQTRSQSDGGAAESSAAGVRSVPPSGIRVPTPTVQLPALPVANISDTPGRSENVRIAVDAAGVAHVVWLDNTLRAGKSDTLLYRKLTREGEWSEVEDLTADVEHVGQPYLVANLNRDVCLVLNSVTGVFTRCLENGSWSPLANPVKLGSRNVFAPALGADRQPRWLAGLNDLQFNGVQLDDGLVAVIGAEFAIDSQDNYHAVWGRLGNPYSIEHRVSHDAGTTWQDQQRLSAPDAEFAEYEALAADTKGGVHLVWGETGKKLYRKWTTPDGWSDPVEFGTEGHSIMLAIDAQDRPVAVWNRDCEVRYSRQTADGTWTPTRVLNADPTPSTCATKPQITIDEQGQQHIVWLQAGTDGQLDVFYAMLPEDS